jgi:hypothetical protein
MRELWSKPWLMSSVALLLLGLYTPLQADPPTQAAQAAADAALAAANAAASAQAAADSSTAVANTVQAGNDAGALINANKAAKDAADAAAAAKSAADLAQQALDLAKQAQAEYDNPKGNPFKAGSLADDASNLAQKATDQAKKAADKAAAAADQVGKAEQSISNDKKNGAVTPLSQNDNYDLENQKTEDTNIKNRNGVRKKNDQDIRKKAIDLIKEDAVNIFDTLLKGSQKHPGDGSLQWNPHAGFFVAVVASNQNSILFPNLNSPLAVPELALPANQSALLQLELINDNPFAVDVTGVTGLLFGDAVTFTSFVGDQTVPADGSTLITLGTVNFTGSADAFTAADFSIITDAAHPGLGPDFPTNFDVATPEPPSITLLILGVLGVAVYCWAQHKRKGCAKSIEVTVHHRQTGAAAEKLFW